MDGRKESRYGEMMKNCRLVGDAGRCLSLYMRKQAKCRTKYASLGPPGSIELIGNKSMTQKISGAIFSKDCSSPMTLLRLTGIGKFDGRASQSQTSAAAY